MDVIRIQLHLPFSWSVADALGHLFYQLLNSAGAVTFFKDTASERQKVLDVRFSPMCQERVAHRSFCFHLQQLLCIGNEEEHSLEIFYLSSLMEEWDAAFQNKQMEQGLIRINLQTHLLQLCLWLFLAVGVSFTGFL